MINFNAFFCIFESIIFGNKTLWEKNFELATAIFKINAILYPESFNVYDSLAETYAKSGDIVKAIENYKIALTFDSGNYRAKNQLKKLEKNE